MTPADETTEAVLARIDERTKSIKEDMVELRDDLQENYVTRVEFAPVARVVYGLVGIAMTAVVVAVVALVVK